MKEECICVTESLCRTAEINNFVNVKVLVTQSCLMLCDPMDSSSLDLCVHGILQARILKWVAIPFSRNLPYLGIESGCSALQADSLLSESPGKPMTKQGEC